MRISDWSSDVCSSDLPRPHGREINCDIFRTVAREKCHTERAAFEPRFQAASKRVHPGVQFAIGECACAGIPDLDEREIVLPAAEQHISEVLGHPGFSTNYKDRKSTRLNSSH